LSVGREIVKAVAKFSAAVLILVAGIVALAGLSRFKARRACDHLVAGQADQMQYYNTLFTFHPQRYLWSREHLGFKPGWIVSYADYSGFRSLGFHVSLVGNILASGASLAVPAVAKRHSENEKFLQGMAQVEAFIQPGASLSDVVAALGAPLSETRFSNDIVRLDYIFGMSFPDRGHFATNGFVVIFSNNVVVTNMPISTM
jgi:hypothetical protein